MDKCYICGAYPNNPCKALDTLKLIRCLDCHTIACINHRKGITGGKCAKCGSSRSEIVALRSDSWGIKASNTTLEKHLTNKTISNSHVGGGSGAPINNGTTSGGSASGGVAAEKDAAISKLKTEASKLKDKAKIITPQESKINGEDSEQELFNKFNMFSMSKNKTMGLKEDDPKLKSLLGTKKLIMDSVAIESINFITKNKIKKESRKAKQKALANNKNVQNLNDIEKDTQTNHYSSNKITNSNIEEYINDLTDITNTETKSYNIHLTDHFGFIQGEPPFLDDLYSMKNKQEKAITTKITNKLNAQEGHLNLTLNNYIFISLKYIERYLHLEPQLLEKYNLNLITGLDCSQLSFDMEEYIDHFREILEIKPFIKGLYAAFGDNPKYSFEEQKELIIKLLDIAYEQDKTFYIGVKGNSIKYWKALFKEYDLSSINFIYTESITSKTTANFIKENNIKVLIQHNINIDFYKEHFADYKKNLVIGSNEAPEYLSQSIDILKKIDESFLQTLINNQ